MPAPTDLSKLLGQTIDNGRLKLVRVLGSGSNGVIFCAEDTRMGYPAVEYAVKCMVKAEQGTRRYGLQRQEVEYHRLLSSHPNVVTLHEVLEDKRHLYLVMDFCRRGDLFTFLSQRREYRGDDEFVKRMFVQVVDALQACHDMGISHRDIKPENFLVSNDGTQVLLTDFGLATTNSHSKTFGAGSSLYMSPECIGIEVLRPAYNTRANDIWALGVILLSMISGHNPWNNACFTDPCFRAFMRNQDFLREMLPISPDANHLLQQIFRRESHRRITLQQIRQMVVDVDTFFMSPHEIAQGGDFLRDAAEAYFKGSGRETFYVPWTLSATTLSDSSDGGYALARQRAHDDNGGELDMDISRDESMSSPSTTATLDTTAPVTPELRAQPLDVEVSDEFGYSPYLSKSLFAPTSRPGSKRSAHSAGFLRRFMDRFMVE